MGSVGSHKAPIYYHIHRDTQVSPNNCSKRPNRCTSSSKKQADEPVACIMTRTAEPTVFLIIITLAYMSKKRIVSHFIDKTYKKKTCSACTESLKSLNILVLDIESLPESLKQ
jgi:hypothetical protein